MCHDLNWLYLVAFIQRKNHLLLTLSRIELQNFSFSYHVGDARLKEVCHNTFNFKDLYRGLFSSDVELNLLQSALLLLEHAVHHITTGHHTGHHPISPHHFLYSQFYRYRCLWGLVFPIAFTALCNHFDNFDEYLRMILASRPL